VSSVTSRLVGIDAAGIAWEFGPAPIEATRLAFRFACTGLGVAAVLVDTDSTSVPLGAAAWVLVDTDSTSVQLRAGAWPTPLSMSFSQSTAGGLRVHWTRAGSEPREVTRSQ